MDYKILWSKLIDIININDWLKHKNRASRIRFEPATLGKEKQHIFEQETTVTTARTEEQTACEKHHPDCEWGAFSCT